MTKCCCWTVLIKDKALGTIGLETPSSSLCMCDCTNLGLDIQYTVDAVSGRDWTVCEAHATCVAAFS